MDEWTQTLEYRDVEDAINVDKDIAVEDEELELKWKRVQTPQKPTPQFGTRQEARVLTVTEMEKSTSHRNAPLLADLVKNKLIDALQVQYDSPKE